MYYVKYLMLALILIGCARPQPKTQHVECSKSFSCCIKVNKDSSVCAKYNGDHDQHKFIYFQIKQ